MLGFPFFLWKEKILFLITHEGVWITIMSLSPRFVCLERKSPSLGINWHISSKWQKISLPDVTDKAKKRCTCSVTIKRSSLSVFECCYLSSSKKNMTLFFSLVVPNTENYFVARVSLSRLSHGGKEKYLCCSEPPSVGFLLLW